MAGRPRRGRYGWRLARKSIRVVGQSLFVAALFNTVCVILAVMGLISPLFAAAAMLFSSFVVVSNSLRQKSHHPVIGVIYRTIDRFGTTQRCENGTVIVSRASLAPRRIPTVMLQGCTLVAGTFLFYWIGEKDDRPLISR
jgi:hypothetical protein